MHRFYTLAHAARQRPAHGTKRGYRIPTRSGVRDRDVNNLPRESSFAPPKNTLSQSERRHSCSRSERRHSCSRSARLSRVAAPGRSIHVRRPTAYPAHTRQVLAPAKACPLCPVCRVWGRKQRRWEGTAAFRSDGSRKRTVAPYLSGPVTDAVVGRYPEDGSPIRKIRAIRGLDAIPHCLAHRRRAGQPVAWGSEPWGPKRRKTSGFLSLALTDCHSRRRSPE